MAAASMNRLRQTGAKQLFIIPFLFTFANALCGFLSVINSLDEHYSRAALFILLAAVMDIFDGRIARALNTTSFIGMELDSLADAISFCCAPAILLYSWQLYQLPHLSMLVLGLYLCCGLFRLARFNAMHTSSPSYFVGLPTTISALFLATLVLYHPWLSAHSFGFLLTPGRLAFLVAVSALLMISSIHFPSYKTQSLQRYHIALLALAAITIALGHWYGQPLMLVAAGVYIVGGFCFGIFKEILRWVCS